MYLILRSALTAIIVTIFMIIFSDPTLSQIALSIVVYFLVGLVIHYVMDRILGRY